MGTHQGIQSPRSAATAAGGSVFPPAGLAPHPFRRKTCLAGFRPPHTPGFFLPLAQQFWQNRRPGVHRSQDPLARLCAARVHTPRSPAGWLHTRTDTYTHFASSRTFTARIVVKDHSREWAQCVGLSGGHNRQAGSHRSAPAHTHTHTYAHSRGKSAPTRCRRPRVEGRVRGSSIFHAIGVYLESCA